jgi:hypothetical protein
VVGVHGCSLCMSHCSILAVLNRGIRLYSTLAFDDLAKSAEQ